LSKSYFTIIIITVTTFNMNSRPATIAIASLATAAALFTGYAVYFDYQRRNNAKFRKSLREF
jgi:hypothetical protein